MGFLSEIFGESKSKSKSFIVQWGDKKKKEAAFSKANKITPQDMFAGFIYGVGSFVRTNDGVGLNEEKGMTKLSSVQQFMNDPALFELGCYSYFQADLWLFHNRPDLRERICNVFMREFVALFRQALKADNLHDIFIERVTKYGALARGGATIDEYLLLLSQLIYRTKNGEKPKSCDLSTPLEIPLELDFGVALQLKVKSWYITILPSMIESVESSIRFLK